MENRNLIGNGQPLDELQKGEFKYPEVKDRMTLSEFAEQVRKLVEKRSA